MMAERFGRTRSSLCSLAIEHHLSNLPAYTLVEPGDYAWHEFELMAHEGGQTLSQLISDLLGRELAERQSREDDRLNNWADDGGPGGGQEGR
jgi:hypothetical protein